MKKTTLIRLFIGLFIGTITTAQEFDVKGTFVDASNTPIPYATILLLHVADSSMAANTITEDNGQFILENVKKGNYLLKASIAEETFYNKLIVVNVVVDLGTIAVERITTLDEVAVIADNPKFEQREDRYVFTIANTSLSQGNTLNALTRTPGMFLNGEQLTFKGDPNIAIMINEKLINLPVQGVLDLLQSTSAETVQSIEIITNPPAKYSAEGGLLINIKMSKNLTAGYNGSITIGLSQGVFPKYNLNTAHQFRTKKTALSLNYGYSDRKTWVRFVDDINFLQPDNSVANWLSNQQRVQNRFTHNLNVFFDYELNENTDLSIMMLNNYRPNNNNNTFSAQTTITGANTRPYDSFLSANQQKVSTLTNSLYVELNRKLSDDKGNLSVMAHATFYDFQLQQNIENDFFNIPEILVDEIDFMTDTNQGIFLYTLQTDYSRPLSKGKKLETGVKYAAIDSDSKLRQQGEDLALTNTDLFSEGNFKYDEKIYAAYATFRSRTEKWNTSFGLRAEYTETKGDLDTEDQTFVNNYLEWFPSFSIQRNFEKGKKVKLYYYRRIKRPRYRDINPFQLIQSFNSIYEGNPRLLPATRHYVAGGYSFNKWLTVEAFYRNEKNQLRELTYQDNETGTIRFISSNLDREIRYGIDITINSSITDFWQVYFTSSITQKNIRFTPPETNEQVQLAQADVIMAINNSLTLLPEKELYVDVDARYNSPMILGNLRMEGFGFVNLSLRKTLFDGQGSVSAGIDDIFSQRIVLSRRSFLDQDNTSLYEPEVPLLHFSFRYKFGNSRIKSNQKRKRQQEVNRI